MAIQQGAADLLARLLAVSNPEVRAAAVFALGTLVQVSATSTYRTPFLTCAHPPYSRLAAGCESAKP